MKRLLLLTLVLPSFTSMAQLPQNVQNFYPGNNNSSKGPSNLFVFNSKLYMYANDSVFGGELWGYDELSPATRITDLTPGTRSINPSSGPHNMAILGGKLYFTVDSLTKTSLYVYDGINPPSLAPNFSKNYFSSSPRQLTVAGNNIYFISNLVGSQDLFSYNGISAPTKVPIAPSSTNGSDANGLAVYRGKLYLNALTNPVAGTYGVYEVDPATNNFHVVTTTAFPNGVYGGSYFVAAGTKLYFFAQKTGTREVQLFSYDGTEFTELTALSLGTTFAGAKHPMVSYRGKILFRGATNGKRYELYSYDTTSGSVSVADTNFQSPSTYGDAIVYKDNVYFTSLAASKGVELWKYNGEKAILVTDLNPGIKDGFSSVTANVNNALFEIYNNKLYFPATNGVDGYELWRLNDPTSVQAVSWQGAVTVYPNPAKGTNQMLAITLSQAENLRVTITDVAGRLVHDFGLRNYSIGKNTVNLRSQNVAGTYFYHIVNSDGHRVASGSFVRE